MTFSYRDRTVALQEAREQIYDLVIVGGGITGVGVAREAAMRGLSVLLLEQGDLAEGTSSRSSKLIHGGLRYLEQFQFGLVFEAVSERRILRRIAPHLVRPIPFLVPVYRDSKHGLIATAAALWVYDALARFRSENLHKTYGRRATLALESGLRSEGLKGGVVYYDAMTDDARLVLETAICAARHGARIVTRARVQDFEATGSVEKLVVCDLEGGGSFDVRGRVFLSATGPWTDRLLGGLSERAEPMLRPTKGVHIVLSPGRLPIQHAVVVQTGDGRIIFVLPWKEQVVIGTTDTDFRGDPGQVEVDQADIEYLLSAANECFPAANLLPEDVVGHWAGVRPLMREEGVDESEVSREHQVVELLPNLLAVIGGKLTTYRLMSEEITDEAVRLLPDDTDPAWGRNAGTEEIGLPGAPDWEIGSERDSTLFAEVIAAGAKEEVALHLLNLYGSRAAEVIAVGCDSGIDSPLAPILSDFPNIRAEIAYGVAEEMVLSAADLLERRLMLRQRDRRSSEGIETSIGELVDELRS